MRKAEIAWTRMILMGLLFVVGTGSVRGQALEWREFDEAMSVADSTTRFVMVSVFAPWCGWCRKMKAEVYTSTGVRACLAGKFVLTQLNREDTDTRYRYNGRRVTPRQLASTFRAEEVPTTVILSPAGEYLFHLSGYVNAESLRLIIAYFSTGAYHTTSFRAFRARPSECSGPLDDRS